MSATRQGYGDDRQPEDPAIGWKNRVRFENSPDGNAFAYRPGEVLTVRAREALELAAELYPDDRMEAAEMIGPFTRLVGVPDPLRFIRQLRLHRGISAQPNHVFFVHCGDCCPPHPATGCWGYGYGAGYGFNPASVNPASVNPASVNPASVNPASVNPASVNPASVNPASVNPGCYHPNDSRRLTGVRRSSARPAKPDAGEATVLMAKISASVAPGAPRVFVLDTGLALVNEPAALKTAGSIGGDKDDVPDSDNDLMLDAAAGHGTFIAGVINQVAPGCDIKVHRVASAYGDVDERDAAATIYGLKGGPDAILSLSFGGGVFDEGAQLLADAIASFQTTEGVVVASAGNDGTCRPAYPAALPHVVSVGALASWGPASFTNYGPWVRACAPGVDLLSMFFEGFQGLLGAGDDEVDDDEFAGWAYWSGTSFAAPVVVGALARMMMWRLCTAKQAVEGVIDAPALLRLPNLGTVVNVI